MARPVGLSSRDLAALAQPLISYAGAMERHRQEPAHPEQVLKLLGMLGDIAHASLQSQVPPPKTEPKTAPAPAPVRAQVTAPAPAPKQAPPRPAAPAAYGTQRPEYQGMAPMLQDQKLVEALLELRKKSGEGQRAEEQDAFLVPQFPKVEAAPKTPLTHQRAPGVALPILRPPRPHR